MKSLLIVLCAIAYTHATVEDAAAPILKSDYTSGPEGFQYSFESGNGIAAQVDGKLKQLAKGEVALEVQGSNQYQSPEGQKIHLTYVANEFGFQPQGDHLPTPPAPLPIPEHIQRSLEYIAAHPYQEKKP